MTARFEKYPYLFKVSPLDVVLVGVILLVSAAFVWPARLGAADGSSAPTRALVYQEGRLLQQIDLREERALTVLGGKMHILVQSGRVSVTEADCPRQICVHAAPVRGPGQVIACVPNKVLIEVKSVAPQFLDAVAH